MGPVLVSATIGVADAASSPSPPCPSSASACSCPSRRGAACSSTGRSPEHWWIQIFPGLVDLPDRGALNLLGEGLRDALDPRLEVRPDDAPNRCSRSATCATHFHTEEGVVRAVDGVSFAIARGETLGVVGESGCGKSGHRPRASCGSTPCRPRRTRAGRSSSAARPAGRCPRPGMRKVRGNEIAMIFQEPMTSLNPVFTVGDQVAEVLELHQGHEGGGRARAARRAARPGAASPRPRRASTATRTRCRGGMKQRVMIAMALACQPGAADRGRADDGARRDDPGADPRRCCASCSERSGHGDPAHHARPRRGRARWPTTWW